MKCPHCNRDTDEPTVLQRVQELVDGSRSMREIAASASVIPPSVVAFVLCNRRA
jgi:hypothetical protein